MDAPDVVAQRIERTAEGEVVPRDGVGAEGSCFQRLVGGSERISSKGILPDLRRAVAVAVALCGLLWRAHGGRSGAMRHSLGCEVARRSGSGTAGPSLRVPRTRSVVACEPVTARLRP